MRTCYRWLGFVLLIVAAWGWVRNPSAAESPEPNEPAAEATFSAGDLEFFEKKVRPILVARCHECHGDNKEPKGGLRLTSRANVLKGGETGPAATVGDVNKSEMILAIRYDGDSYQMPPKGKLPDEEIETLTEWVRRGLPWPKTDETATTGDKVPAISFAERAKQWPFTPLDVAPAPMPADAAWADNVIDAYIFAGLDAAELKPAPEAGKAVWLRRATYDIVGLPPTPDEIDEFLADDAPDAYERAIDRLLASPHYGERWGRHWLDLVRYAETLGHEFDFEILHAFRYRDYVIRALNEGVPYDRFVIEHIAGDLMSNPRRDPVTGENESIKGTGFYWLGQGKHSPVDIRAEECDTVDNQIDVFSKTFLGLTVACARCHDHKFDPIGTADYYALAGFLQSSRQQWADVSDPEQKEQIAVELAELKQSVAAHVVDRWHESANDGHVAQALLEVVPLLQLDLRERGPFPEPRLEGESLKINAIAGGEARPQQMEPFGKGKWSDDKQLWWTDGVVGSKLTVNIPVEKDGDYRIYAAFTKARDYGIVEISLDDQRIGEPIDLYDPTVIPTGAISLGEHPLKAGEHRLTFEITGSNEKAVPSFMVGLDYVALVSAAEEANAEARRNLLAQADPQLVKLAKSIKARSASNVGDPFHAWDVLGQANSDDAFAKGKTELRDRLIALRERARSQIEPQPEWTKFDSDTAFDQWRPSGMAFWAGPLQSGNLVVSDNGTGLSADVVTRPRLHSGGFSNKFQGFVRSPTFSIERKHIDYLIRRTGGNANPGRANKNGNISLIVDGFQVIRNPLYGNLTFVVPNDGQWHWHRQNVSKHIGTKAYIEIGDEDDGFIEVAAIRLTDNEQAPALPNDLLIELLADDAITTPQQLASAYEHLIRDSFDAFIGSLIGGEPIGIDRAEFLQLLAEVSPTPISADVQTQLAQLEQHIQPPTWALAMTDGTSENEYVLVRGNHTKPGELVERRFLEVFHYSADSAADDTTYETRSGRLELAEKLVDDAAPLLARVIVNRLWQHHFGEGIVPTPDNFGALGVAPTHPELLDALARELIAHDWSLKHIHRLIVSSKTYRQSSRTTDSLAEERDPNNRLLHRMNVKRLEGEPLRDAMLVLSGRLNSKMYGPSVMPHLTPFMEGRGRPGESGPLDGDGRRSIYIGVRRNFLSPMFLAFDLPTPLSTMGKRSTSNVPAQALTLMNNPFVWEQSTMWADRLGEREPDAEARINRMYQEAFARPPTDEERQLAHQFLESAAWPDLAHLLMNLKEFVFIP